MNPQGTAHRRGGHSRWLTEVEQLEAVARELRGHYMIDAHLVPDQASPYVSVTLESSEGERVGITSVSPVSQFHLVRPDSTHPRSPVVEGRPPYGHGDG